MFVDTTRMQQSVLYPDVQLPSPSSYLNAAMYSNLPSISAHRDAATPIAAEPLALADFVAASDASGTRSPEPASLFEASCSSRASSPLSSLGVGEANSPKMNASQSDFYYFNDGVRVDVSSDAHVQQHNVNWVSAASPVRDVPGRSAGPRGSTKTDQVHCRAVSSSLRPRLVTPSSAATRMQSLASSPASKPSSQHPAPPRRPKITKCTRLAPNPLSDNRQHCINKLRPTCTRLNLRTSLHSRAKL